METPVHGRGAVSNPGSRFERLHYVAEPDPDLPPEEQVAPRTIFLRDPARSIIAENDSPDVAFDASINPYRGCEHGCVYCFARPTHEYLGWSAGLDFETRILVKEEAPALLRRELRARRYRPRVLGVSGVTDAYQPVERELRLTRGCLEVLAEHRNPVMVVTKSHLVTRDVDLLGELARHRAACVLVSVTTLDPELAARMEPRASRPARRLDAIAALAGAGIPTGVLVAPVVPALTDHEMPALLAAAASAGATFAGYVVLRLPHGVKDLFLEWVQAHYPLKRAKVEARVREMWGGGLYDPAWHVRQRGEGPFAEQLKVLFDVACRKHRLGTERRSLSAAAFRRGLDDQPSLFAQADRRRGAS